MSMAGETSCDMEVLKKGPWAPEEDQRLIDYINRNGYGNWCTLPKRAGLLRCGKSCRLRWTNYLKPGIKRGNFSLEERQTIIQLHRKLGNKWSAMATHLPGRTANEIKNYWHTQIKKKLIHKGLDLVTDNMAQFLGDSALGNVTALLHEVAMKEYMKIVALAMLHQQLQTDQYAQTLGAISVAQLLPRSHIENSLSNSDFTTNYVMPQNWAQSLESGLGSPHYSELLCHAQRQLQSQHQIIEHIQHLSSTSILHGLNTQLENQTNNNDPHSAFMIDNQLSLVPDDIFKADDYNNSSLNDSTSNMLQQPSASRDINSSVALDTSIQRPKYNLFEFSNSYLEAVPEFTSSTSSPSMFNNSDLLTKTSCILDVTMSRPPSTTTATPNGSYPLPPDFF